jgi:hypothetical protein
VPAGVGTGAQAFGAAKVRFDHLAIADRKIVGGRERENDVVFQ